MNHITFAYRNLVRRPIRSILTGLGVGFAVGSFISLYGLSRSVDDNAQQMLDERGIHLTMARRGTAELFGGTIRQTVASQLTTVPGIMAITGELISLVAIDQDAQVLALGWPDDSFLWRNVPIKEGRLPRAGERNVLLLGKDIAFALKKRLGDRIVFLGESFEIVGLTNYESVVNRNAMIVPLDNLQKATFRTGAVTFLHARVDKPDDAAEIERISRAIEGMAEVTVSTSDSVLRNEQNLGLLRAVATAMAWVALFMGALMVLNTLLMAVLERTREIGILSAIGWSPPRIMGALMLEGLVLTVLGSLVGAAIGIVGSHLLSSIPAIGRYITVRPTFTIIAATAAVAIVLGIVGSFYPAWLATRQTPGTTLEQA